MARLIALKQTAPERFLARFDTGEELRTTLAVVTDYHLSCGRELTEAELDALRAFPLPAAGAAHHRHARHVGQGADRPAQGKG